MTNELLLTNDQGRTFQTRTVRMGDMYGAFNDIGHLGPPMIEFYDTTYRNVNGFGPLGQFVARYYASTLSEYNGHGLSLCGYEPVWSLSSANMDDVREFARKVLAE